MKKLTPEDEQYIIDNYGILKNAEIQNNLGCTKFALSNKISDLKDQGRMVRSARKIPDTEKIAYVKLNKGRIPDKQIMEYLSIGKTTLDRFNMMDINPSPSKCSEKEKIKVANGYITARSAEYTKKTSCVDCGNFQSCKFGFNRPKALHLDYGKCGCIGYIKKNKHAG